MVFESTSSQMTFEFAKKIGENLKSGDVLCLDGDLGVGKTVFTKGVAAGLGIKRRRIKPYFYPDPGILWWQAATLSF